MTEFDYDVVIIGGGPGGYVAAIKAAQLGMKVACVEKRDTLGGTCLNVGCIPSKAMLNASHKYDEVASGHLEGLGIDVKKTNLNLKSLLSRKNKIVDDLTKGISYLFKKNKIDYIHGHGQFRSSRELAVLNGDQTLRILKARNFIIATGSRATDLPGVKVDEKQIVSSTGALDLKTVPDHLVVVGGGYIGLELGSVWRRFGAKVTVVEYCDRIVPAMDKELGKSFLKELQKQKISFKLSTKVTNVKRDKKGLHVSLENVEKGTTEIIKCDVVLSSIGRKPNTENLGLENIGVGTDQHGCLEVDKDYQTHCSHVYAIGDVIHGPMLAHKAEEEGVAVIEHLNGQKPHVNYKTIPSVIYTHPEVAAVGQTEEELKALGQSYCVGKFPFSANSRARANDDTVGFVKILTNKDTDEVLGVHILHSDAGTMIAQCVLAMEYRASSEDIARTCHAHPTVNEAIKEAALSAHFKPIHI